MNPVWQRGEFSKVDYRYIPALCDCPGQLTVSNESSEKVPMTSHGVISVPISPLRYKLDARVYRFDRSGPHQLTNETFGRALFGDNYFLGEIVPIDDMLLRCDEEVKVDVPIAQPSQDFGEKLHP